MKMRMLLLIFGAFTLLFSLPGNAPAGQVRKSYTVLSPITHDNLTIFPVVSEAVHDTHGFITLDQGLHSGEVVVTEAGQGALIRPRGNPAHQPTRGGDEVNRLVLMNNSDHPLILLAGEVVTGGKQDRIVAKDRIVPANSDPVDLSVFCIEHGRWTETSANFKSSASGSTSYGFLVQPSVRRQAMAEKDQQQVWEAVGDGNRGLANAVSPGRAETVTVESSTGSYAKVMQSETVKNKVEEEAKPIEHSYSSLLSQLKDAHAAGVVVAVNGEIVWADLFGSNQLLQQYWPKLVRSYVAESLSAEKQAGGKPPSVADAQQFLDNQEATHEVVDSEPGVYRQIEKTAGSYKVFALQSLLPGKDFDVHISKMTMR